MGPIRKAGRSRSLIGDTGDMLDYADITAAAKRLAGVAHRTPVLTSRSLNERVGADVFLKAENLQRTGSFKFRGAYNTIAALEPDERGHIVTHSSGNHGQAVAFAASRFGVPATIVMPSDAPEVKKAAVAGYGGYIVEYDRMTGDRNAIAAQVVEDTSGTLVPPFDHWNIMAGQGTVAVELIEDVGELDAMLVCTGGGGLLAGCATAMAELSPRGKVWGVEPVASNDTQQSLEVGHVVTIDQPVTIADGQALRAPGELTFSVNALLVEGIVTVTDAEIVESMRFIFDRLRVVVEPSGASALAALLAGKIDLAGSRVGVTLSGGNVDRITFAKLLSEGV